MAAGLLIKPIELARAELEIRFQREWPAVVVSLTTDASAKGPGISNLGSAISTSSASITSV